MPDTSPRGEGVPNDASYDLGVGAGFYVNATQEPWSQYFQMYTYVTEELPALLEKHYNLKYKSISGHSMGGHGALTIALKNPKEWTSVSALAPICNPTSCPWGKKAFNSYLGSVEAGSGYDASLLLSSPLFDDILVDQGGADEFLLQGQLLPEALLSAADKCKQKITYHCRDGFDHSYFFVAACITNHIEFHATRLQSKLAGK